MQFKIPPHLSKQFSKLETKEEKDKFIKSYRYWYEHEFTRELLEHFGCLIQESLREEDSKFDFTTLFQSKYYGAGKKGERALLRKLLKQLNPEVKS